MCATIMTLTATSYAQQLDDKSKTEVILSDNTHLILYKAYSSGQDANIYYYLPVNLHVSFNGNKPEISLLLYNDNENKGGILHFLLSWGLTRLQEEEARNLLNKKLNDTTMIAGSVLADAAPVSFKITSDDGIAGILRGALTQNSQVPLIPGSKLAASFKLSDKEAILINEVIKRPEKIGKGTIQMIFIYKSMVKDGYSTRPVEHEWILEMSLKDIFEYLK
jgi:hypothetical protein